MKQVSARAAVFAGILSVNIPVFPIMFAPMSIYAFAAEPVQRHHPGGDTLPAIMGLFLFGIVLAWIWWSIMVPRWRLWAWERVEDLDDLKQKAVRAGIIWPEGWIFEKTEFQSEYIKAKLRDLEARKGTHA